MSIIRAEPDYLTDIQRLLQTAYYRYVDLSHEDLPDLLQKAPTAVGVEDSQVWGFLGVQPEMRPSTLPPDAPTRVQVRGLALERQRRPVIDVEPLFAAVIDQLLGKQNGEPPSQYDLQLLCYGSDSWLGSALAAAGFRQIEAVQFYQLDRLHRHIADLPAAPRPLELAPAAPEALLPLAELDIAAFPPLWHFGRRDLFEMLIRCRVQAAWWQGHLAGYTAICANNRKEAQLARLAVHPDLQGLGIGRALVADAIRYAAGEFGVLVLNTQTTNTRSQRLYRGFGFRTIGEPVPVLAHTIGARAP